MFMRSLNSLKPLFWTSSDICPGFQSLGRSLFACFLACVILRFTSGATPAHCISYLNSFASFPVSIDHPAVVEMSRMAWVLSRWRTTYTDDRIPVRISSRHTTGASASSPMVVSPVVSVSASMSPVIPTTNSFFREHLNVCASSEICVPFTLPETDTERDTENKYTEPHGNLCCLCAPQRNSTQPMFSSVLVSVSVLDSVNIR